MTGNDLGKCSIHCPDESEDETVSSINFKEDFCSFFWIFIALLIKDKGFFRLGANAFQQTASKTYVQKIGYNCMRSQLLNTEHPGV